MLVGYEGGTLGAKFEKSCCWIRGACRGIHQYIAVGIDQQFLQWQG